MNSTGVSALTTGAHHWRQRSKCRTLTPDEFDKLFFPSSGRSIKKARSFCEGCRVKDDCLEFALNNDCVGIWAGTNYEERRGIVAFRSITGVTMSASDKLTEQPVAATAVEVPSVKLKRPIKKAKQKRSKKKVRTNFRVAT